MFETESLTSMFFSEISLYRRTSCNNFSSLTFVAAFDIRCFSQYSITTIDDPDTSKGYDCSDTLEIPFFTEWFDTLCVKTVYSYFEILFPTTRKFSKMPLEKSLKFCRRNQYFNCKSIKCTSTTPFILRSGTPRPVTVSTLALILRNQFAQTFFLNFRLFI